MGDPIQEQRETGDRGTPDNKSGDVVVRVLLATPGQQPRVMRRGDYIDNIFTKLNWHQILHTYTLEFDRAGKSYWVEVGADLLGWNQGMQHPMQFKGRTLPTKVVTPYNYYENPLRAMQALSNTLKGDNAAGSMALATFYQETPERGSVIIPTIYTGTTAPRLFDALLQLHGDKPIDDARHQAWLDVAADFEGGVKALAVARLTPVIARSAAGKAAATATRAAALGRAAMLEIRVAVISYGPSAAAGAYLGRSAWAFYCRNAATINTRAIIGADIAFNLAGQDTGLVGTGDVLVFTQPAERASWEIVKAEVVTVEKAAQRVIGKLKDAELVSAEVAAKHFDSGKLIHHIPKVPPKDLRPAPIVGASKIGDTAVSAGSRATHADDAAARLAAQGKPNKTKTVGPVRAAAKAVRGVVGKLSDLELAKLKEGLARLADIEVELGKKSGGLFARIKGTEAYRRLFANKFRLSDFDRLAQHWPQQLARQYVDEIQKLILNGVKQDSKLAQEVAEAFARNKVDAALLNRLPKSLQSEVKNFVNKRWDTIREAFWRNVFDDPGLVDSLKKIGITFPGRGRTPVLEIGGKKLKITLDHIARKVENPLEAFDPKNLRTLSSRDNSVVKEALVRNIEQLTGLNLDKFNALGRDAERLPKEIADELGKILDALPNDEDLFRGLGWD